VAYCPEGYQKLHGWWVYGGGEMINWGARHLDIAMWAMNLQITGPTKVAGPTELPTISGGFDVSADFRVKLELVTGEVIEIRTTAERVRPSGILYEGEKGIPPRGASPASPLASRRGGITSIARFPKIS
jgi:hypothetical protein